MLQVSGWGLQVVVLIVLCLALIKPSQLPGRERINLPDRCFLVTFGRHGVSRQYFIDSGTMAMSLEIIQGPCVGIYLTRNVKR